MFGLKVVKFLSDYILKMSSLPRNVRTVLAHSNDMTLQNKPVIPVKKGNKAIYSSQL